MIYKMTKKSTLNVNPRTVGDLYGIPEFRMYGIPYTCAWACRYVRNCI